jgi:pyruvate,water dikinase
MVAREFNLPCIVNTKEATKKLKNGQEIILDANKGIVYEP